VHWFLLYWLLFFLAVKQKPMYCDRSAYYQKAIKATARPLNIYTRLLWLFLLFGRLVTPHIVSQSLMKNITLKQNIFF